MPGGLRPFLGSESPANSIKFESFQVIGCGTVLGSTISYMRTAYLAILAFVLVLIAAASNAEYALHGPRS